MGDFISLGYDEQLVTESSSLTGTWPLILRSECLVFSYD